MTGADVYKFRRKKGLEKKQLAYLIGCHPRTIYNIEQNDSRTVKDDYVFAIMELNKLVPDIKIVVKKRLEELRLNGHAI